PILLHDPVRNVIGMIHAGWVGTVKQIAEQAVKTMTIRYGSVPADIRAGIGPSIGPDHYEVGEDVNAAVMKVFGDQTNSLLIKRNGKLFFDLWEANRLSLTRAGVHTVQVARLCTACSLEDWYSHRAENGQTGRFGALLGLRG
ncbi:MAG: polyphenol oxidase family protein, partial [Anaerolineaceae bacterium]|nr:polyphenol oxidase family protein [Anaerolineaceae bacterium]